MSETETGTVADPPKVNLGDAMRALWANGPVKLAVATVVVGYAIYAVVAPQVDALEGTVGESFVEEFTRIPAFVILAWMIFALTRTRALPNFAERAPDTERARFELLVVIAYAAAAMVVLGFLGITYHPQENDPALSRSDLVWWAIVNPIVYGLIPYLWLRARGNSDRDLGLRGNNWRLDWKVLVVIGGIDMVLAITLRDYLDLEPGQMVTGSLLTLLLYGLGAGIPVVVLTQAVIAPRVYALTGSYISAGVACTAAYALFSMTDQGLIYDSAGHAVMAFLFISVVNFGPGLVKAMLTIRTGNAWAHFLAYHVVSFHIWGDAALIVEVFEL
ncbi:MAG: hypothetical protein AAGC53_15875 [Actinomycetota bacterium]